MNQTVVVYQSKYGSTQKYAQWIAEALGCELMERGGTKIQDLEKYETIVYGGGLYAGGLAGFDLIVKNFDSLADKDLIVFTCGLADPENPDNIANIAEGLKKVMTPSMQEKIKLFHFRGGMDYAKLSFLHKGMMAMVRKMTLKKAPGERSEEDERMLETYGKAVDYTDPAAIGPLVSYVKSLPEAGRPQ